MSVTFSRRYTLAHNLSMFAFFVFLLGNKISHLRKHTVPNSSRLAFRKLSLIATYVIAGRCASIAAMVDACSPAMLRHDSSHKRFMDNNTHTSYYSFQLHVQNLIIKSPLFGKNRQNYIAVYKNGGCKSTDARPSQLKNANLVSPPPSHTHTQHST